jgi:hypothetical protein
LGPGGRKFESCRPDKFIKPLHFAGAFCCARTKLASVSSKAKSQKREKRAGLDEFGHPTSKITASNLEARFKIASKAKSQKREKRAGLDEFGHPTSKITASNLVVKIKKSNLDFQCILF